MSDDRPTAILTKGQREYLRGQREPTQERTMRTRIRERLREGIKDLDLILRNLEPEEIQKALELRRLPDEDRFSELAIENGLSSTVGVVYLACLDREEATDWLSEPSEGRTFEKRAKSGIRDALNRLSVSVRDVTVSLEIERGDAFSELDGLDPAELAEYSMTELQQAHLNDAITDEQFFGAMREQGYHVDNTEE